MYVNVVFVIRCLYGAMNLILVKEQRLISIIYYYHYYYYYYYYYYMLLASKKAVRWGHHPHLHHIRELIQLN